MLEYAMVKHADGTVVPRHEAMESLKRWKAAVHANGGVAPTDRAGQRMSLDTQGRWWGRDGSRGPNVASNVALNQVKDALSNVHDGLLKLAHQPEGARPPHAVGQPPQGRPGATSLSELTKRQRAVNESVAADDEAAALRRRLGHERFLRRQERAARGPVVVAEAQRWLDEEWAELSLWSDVDKMEATFSKQRADVARQRRMIDRVKFAPQVDA